ncbi:MAG: winged helix-turn-helix transcriptional regulator [Phycisphaerae bacterium]|jgi:predicted HTH transcriptional regulator|nr:winged helix-turn-helix transcriptional regulator [Phycisphaerae bacterium]
MVNVMELLREHECKTLEFKRDLSSPDKVMRTLVAFANNAGGTLLVGVEDSSHRVIGVPDVTKVEEQLANFISDRIEPRLLPEIHVVPWRKTHLLAVEVFPSSSRPHYLKAAGFPQGVYVRVGSTSRQADTAAVAELQRIVRGISFDEEALPELNSEAIDFRVASECFAPVRKLSNRDLRTLQMVTSYQRQEVPTVGGVILFGADRLKIFPDAFLHAGCFAGTDRSVIVDSVAITDSPVLAVEKALHFAQRNLRHALEITGIRHRDVWEFPAVALREAIINAFVHADYAQRGSPLRLAIFSNRIEVDNPGNLAPGLTIEDIRRGVSKLRNRIIARVFHELKLIEQWGSGIQRMTAACQRLGLPDPQLEEIGSGFRVTFWRERIARPQMDEMDAAIIDYLRLTPGASTSRIAEQVKRSSRAIQSRLKRLVEAGQVVAVGSSAKDPHKGYHLKKTSGIP